MILNNYKKNRAATLMTLFLLISIFSMVPLGSILAIDANSTGGVEQFKNEIGQNINEGVGQRLNSIKNADTTTIRQNVGGVINNFTPRGQNQVGQTVVATGITGAVGVATCFLGEIVGALSSVASVVGINIPVNSLAGNAINSGTMGNTKAVCLKDNVLDPMATMLAKQLVGNLTQSTVNWINTGNAGNPLYITNQGQYLSDVSNRQRDLFINELNNTNSPYKKQVMRSIILGDQTTFQKKAQYTLNYVTGSQAETNAFLRGEDKAFTWDNWMALNTNPANNPYGFEKMAQSNLSSKQTKAASTAKSEVEQSGGFLSIKKCVDWLVEPGNTDYLLDGSPHPGLCAPGGYENQTPGVTIANALNKSTDSDLRQLELAQSFDQIITAFLGNLFNFGSSGLRGQTRQVSSASNNSNFQANKRNLVEGIDKTIKIEESYLAPKIISRDLLRNKSNIERKIDDLIANYNLEINLLNQISSAPNKRFPAGYSITDISKKITEVTNIKNNTINGTWVSRSTSLEKDVSDTQTKIRKLDNLANSAYSNSSATELASISQQFARISATIHTSNDIYYANLEKEDIQKVIADIDSRTIALNSAIQTLQNILNPQNNQGR